MRKLITDGTVQFVEQTVTRNLLMGITAMFAALVGLAVVAIPARDDELTVSVLRQRLSDLRWLTGIAAVIMILTVVTTKGLVDWSLGLLCDPQATALEPVGDAIGNYWGAAATGVLTAALIPSYLSWSHDVERFAIREKPNSTQDERQELLASEHLYFSLTTSLLTFITVVMPALTGMFIEVLKASTR
jgi:hypothetical protein